MRGWPALLLLLSPLILLAYLPFLETINTSYLSLVYNTIFLGSFHVLFTPLFSQFVDSKSKRIEPASWLVGACGVALALYAGTADPSAATKLAGAAVVFSVAFHSLQQQLGLLALFENLKNWHLVKFLFNTLIALIGLNILCLFLDWNTEIAKPVLAALSLLCVISILGLAARSRFTFFFLLRMFSWPAGIYLVALQPWGLAIHGIEYAALYFWAAPQLKSRPELNTKFWILAALTSFTFIAGSILILTGSLGSIGGVLLSLHFGIQFRHYWLDRQIFKMSKPMGREMSLRLRGLHA